MRFFEFFYEFASMFVSQLLKKTEQKLNIALIFRQFVVIAFEQKQNIIFQKNEHLP